MLRIREDRQALLRRIEISRLAVGTALSLLAIAYWFVQIVRGDYYFSLSENNRIRAVKITAPPVTQPGENDGVARVRVRLEQVGRRDHRAYLSSPQQAPRPIRASRRAVESRWPVTPAKARRERRSLR